MKKLLSALSLAVGIVGSTTEKLAAAGIHVDKVDINTATGGINFILLAEPTPWMDGIADKSQDAKRRWFLVRGFWKDVLYLSYVYPGDADYEKFVALDGGSKNE